jgi:AcrR family transcriptional regulator
MTRQGAELMAQLEQGFSELMPDKGTRQILMAALDVFARKGLTGAKISDIAEKAGFSQGFVYNYFKSKDDIFTKIVDLASEGAGAAVTKAAKMDGTPYEKIYWMTEALLSPESIAMQHWRLIMLQASTSEAIPEEAKRISKEKMKRPVRLLMDLLQEGQRLGEIVAEDTFVQAIAYFSMAQGLGITRVQVSSAVPFPTVELVLRFMRAPGCPAVPRE